MEGYIVLGHELEVLDILRHIKLLKLKLCISSNSYLWIFPPLLPLIGVRLSHANVAKWRIKPDVEHLKKIDLDEII